MLNFVLFFIAAFAAVILGNKTKVNMGFWAYIFAFILGFFRAGMSISSIVAKFPSAIYFALMTSALFFGFAANNGTMSVLANKLMWRFRKQAWMAPLIMFIVGSVISLCGVNGTTGLVLSAICYAVAASVSCDPLPVLMVVGAAAGCWGMFPWCTAGAVNFGTLSAAHGQDAGYFAVYIGGIVALVVELITVVIVCIKVRAFQKKPNATFEMTEKPEFNPEQKKTFIVIITSLLLIVVPTLLNVLFKTAFTKKLTAILSVQTVWTAGIILLTLMNIGDLKHLIVNKVSWNAVILVTGMSTLFALAKDLGVVDIFADLLNKVPAWTVVPALAAVCGILSFFVSGLVIVPMFTPLATAFVAASGHSLNIVLTAIIAGGIVSSISPVSSGGAYLLSAAPNDEISAKVYSGLFKSAIFNVVLVFLAFVVLQTFI